MNEEIQTILNATAEELRTLKTSMLLAFAIEPEDDGDGIGDV